LGFFVVPASNFRFVFCCKKNYLFWASAAKHNCLTHPTKKIRPSFRMTTITFESLGLNSAVLKAISDMGFVTPTPIQEQAIPALLTGSSDLVALAQTGTGKTAAFGLPLLTLLDFNSRDTQAIVLAPTRELCMQIAKDIVNYSVNMSNVNVVAVYGGASITNQITELRRGAQIIVATPGRLIDLIDRRKVNLENVRFAVLDEADEMLNMGFKDDLDTILASTPDTKNTWLFSATMPNEVLRISKNYMNNPTEVTVSKNEGNVNIEHIYYTINNRDRYLALKRIADFNPDIFAIVFCRTKIETQQVADMLIKDGYNADALHGDLSQAQRDHVMNRYRSRNLQMLVATDVAARGIDVNDVTHVINYNLPDEIESYTHRSGRTARAGKKGVSIALVTSKEQGKIKMLERLIKSKFTPAMIPNGKEVCEKQLVNLMERLHTAPIDEAAIEGFLPAIYDAVKDLDKEEILKRFVSLEFNRFLEYYKKAPNLNAGMSDRNPRERPERGGREERGGSFVGNSNVSKLFINLGKMDDVDRDFMIDYIAHTANVPAGVITWVGIKDIFSFVEVKPEFAQPIIDAFRGQKFKQRPVRIELRDADGGGGSRERSGGGRDFKPRGEFGGNRGGSFGGNRGGSFGGDRDRNSGRGFNRSNDRNDRGSSRPFERNDRPFADRPARPVGSSDGTVSSPRRFEFSLPDSGDFDRSKRSSGGDKRKRK
jgi:ATP-dependent RNA helicase DeaD